MKHVLGLMLGLAVSAPAVPDDAIGIPPPIRVAESERITVSDLLRHAAIGDPGSIGWNDRQTTRASAYSPDRKWVAIVVRGGNPEEATNEARLLIYRTDELLLEGQAKTIAKFATTTQYQPIALVRWLEDSTTMIFAATDGGLLPQIYRVDIQSGGLARLTDEQAPLLWYDIDRSGSRLVTVSERAIHPPAQDPTCLKSGCRVTADRLHAAERGIVEGPTTMTFYDLDARHGRIANSRIFLEPEKANRAVDACRDELQGGLSPDGRFGLRICRIRTFQWPAWWADYSAVPQMGQLVRQGHSGYLRQWMLTDFATGLTTPLGDAPFYYGNLSDQAAPVWIDGGRRVLLVGAFEPLNLGDTVERKLRASRFAILSIDPATRRSERIALLSSQVARVVGSNWDQRSQTLVVNATDADRTALAPIAYRRAGQRWHAVATGRTAVPRPNAPNVDTRVPELIVEQSLNASPRLVAVDSIANSRHQVLDPNPWLAQRKLGRVEPISWVTSDGRTWNGGLYYPPDFSRGTRYPLVLQTHGFNAHEFSLWGNARNFAAQPLAARGMLVLQVAENTYGAVGAQEWTTVLKGYEAAIDHLDGLGLIDRDRVGIVGWSRSGAYTGYVLTHSSYKFSAAFIAESSDIGWWSYLANGQAAAEAESIYGARPFGDGLDVWRELSPSFNLDRVDTPVMMWGIRLSSLWDWYAGLNHLHKPVEYWNLPDGTHDVFKASERLRTNQLLVDWFEFWLKGTESDAGDSPMKAEQYARWREMRDQQDATRRSEQSYERRPDEGRGGVAMQVVPAPHAGAAMAERSSTVAY
jgi:hypothetical protein